MRVTGCLVFYVVFFFYSSELFGQQNGEGVLFSNGKFITGRNLSKPTFKKENILRASFDKNYYLLLQFDTIPSKKLQADLKRAGIELYTYLPGKAYLAKVGSNFDFALAGSYKIASIHTVPSFYKIDKKLANYNSSADKSNSRKIVVSFYPGMDRLAVLSQLRLAGAIISSTKFDTDNSVFVQADNTSISAIAALPFVTDIHLQPISDQLLNYNNVGAHGISGLNALNGKNLNGKGVTIGIGDNADINTHVDFTGRLINRTAAMPALHGTHVAGTLAGAGIINIKNHGMAPRATIVNQFFSDIIVNSPTYIADYDMVVTNNSYFSAELGCPGTGEYDFLSNYVDRQQGRHQQLLHVIAAGNDGLNTCAPFPSGFATVKSGWQTAKNVLTVGAINTSGYSIANFSSRGPVKDGRIKPEITSGGVNVTSTFSNDTYGVNNGTSMASPVVTGALSLMYERYRQLHAGANPTASLMKALVCNTAEDMGNAGPDFTFGFGMLNARRAVAAIEENRYFINATAAGGNSIHSIVVPANTRRLKVLLYWADTAAALNAATSLVNDLDLTVAEPSAVLHYPLVLNPSSVTVNDPAIEGVDHTNNIEQVVIENPAAGTYSINVNGWTVPFGDQEYIVSYELVQPSVTVEYPFGGEKLVPGETENIRWSAYGNEMNNFTIEYSTNNGSNWIMIDNNVPAASRSYAWSVPAALITNQALVRVSRNGSALADESDFTFTVLGSPVITSTNVCEGAVQLNWPVVAGATSYDIVQLRGDSMQVVANTTDGFYLIKGLDKRTKTWLAVAAKNGAVVGRRSIALGIVPDSGPCTLAVFNNDIKVDSVLEPNTARQGFANAGNAIKAVKVAIKNLGSVAVGGPFDISYSYGGTAITETISPVIAAGATFIYTFTGTFPIIPAGFTYHFKSWISLAADPNHLNDTAYKTVKYINNDAIAVLPVTEGFESMPAADFRLPEMAIGDNKRLDFLASSSRGRARSFVNTGFAYTGTKAITLDQTPYNNITTTDSLLFSYNLSNHTAKQLRLDFYYKNHGQIDAPGNRVWMRGSENNAWVVAYDLFANQAAVGSWKRGVININEVLNSAVPVQTVSSTFQIKIGQEGNTSANNANSVIDIDDGYTFDDFTIADVSNDVGVVKIISPDINGCALGTANPVSIRVKNYNSNILTNLPVSYQINGGAIVTENIPSLGPDQSMDYVFNQTANLSAYIAYTINVWVKYPSDNYSINDSIVNFRLHNSPLITTYPYLQHFESNDGFFHTRGTNTSWQWGTPAKDVISKASSGSKAWVTNLSGNYNDNETSYLYSPCFNLQGLVQPVLSFSHIFMMELNYDYSWVEYSADGLVWQKLGIVGNGTNWYNEAPETAWGGTNARWHVASFNLPVSATNIRFRFVMSSDAGVTEEGIGIDDIHVFDRAPVYTGLPVTNVSQTVNNSDWVHFSSGGKRIVSLNANGANLGLTSVQVHPYLEQVRSSNNSYYANRNIVVRSANPPTGNVGVRFYFTEDEVQDMILANSCVTCLKPADAYEPGITQYSGNATDENGLLADDVTGLFRFITPANVVIVPYDNGYYAEFSVQSFSEFWLSMSNIKPAASGVCPGENILFGAATNGTVFQWQEDNGAGYVNIVNGIRYSGANTASLQLINLPTSFSGYKYRCVTDGVTGPANMVRFTNSWNGNTSANWFLAANWSCGLVPDQYTDVIIPGGLSLYPTINANTAIKSISLHPGTMVTLANAVLLEIKGK